MQYSEFKKEMQFILTCSLFLDLAVYLGSVAFLGFTLRMALALITGTIVLAVNLRLLYASVIRHTGGQQTVRNPMMKGYLLRSLIACLAIAAGFLLSFLNPVGIMLPLLYPKLIYTVHSIIVRR